MNTAKRWIGLVLFILVCLGVGGLGAAATTPEIDGWYRTLAKPTWTPPDSWFGPVWTMLYICMAIAGWHVWQRGGLAPVRGALAVFALQLLLNLAWSWIFFRWHQVGWACVEIVILWGAIAATIILFARHSRLSVALLVPYWMWVTFATALNFAIWQLNA